MAWNYAKVAPRMGFFFNMIVIAMGCVGIYVATQSDLQHLGEAIYTLLVGLLIMPLETPFLCLCISNVSMEVRLR